MIGNNGRQLNAIFFADKIDPTEGAVIEERSVISEI